MNQPKKKDEKDIKKRLLFSGLSNEFAFQNPVKSFTMAMSVPKVGFQRFMKDGAKVKGCWNWKDKVNRVYVFHVIYFSLYYTIEWEYATLNYVLFLYFFQYFRGVEEAVMKNIEAAVHLAATVRSSYGPYGLWVGLWLWLWSYKLYSLHYLFPIPL